MGWKDGCVNICDVMNSRDLDGRAIRVNLARTRPPLPDGAPAPGSRSAPPSRSSGACRDFQRGQCTRGDKCRFSHDGASSNGDRSPRYGPPYTRMMTIG